MSIPPSGEAAYVIDGLLYHEADLNISVHHTDGGGVSDHVFALAHLLGFPVAPRIPNLTDRKLYAFGPASTWLALAPFTAGKPDDKLIAAQWDEVLRMAASVRTGTVSASLRLKRLGAHPRQNGSTVLSCPFYGVTPFAILLLIQPPPVPRRSKRNLLVQSDQHATAALTTGRYQVIEPVARCGLSKGSPSFALS